MSLPGTRSPRSSTQVSEPTVDLKAQEMNHLILTTSVFVSAAAAAVVHGSDEGPTTTSGTAFAGFAPAPVVHLAAQPPAHLIVDAPLPDQLATGYVVIRYRAENLRILPVYGPAALELLPRIGHLHVTVDDSAWHWLDASGEPLSINGLPPGPHKVLIELEGPTHQLIDSATVSFQIPPKKAAQ